MSEPKRLFFAIELPGEVREQLIHWRAAQFPLKRVVPSPPIICI